jgi:hypothetical protein
LAAVNQWNTGKEIYFWRLLHFSFLTKQLFFTFAALKNNPNLHSGLKIITAPIAQSVRVEDS